jgi:SAM-dependent methyltransferase
VRQDKTTVDHWNEAWAPRPRLRVPSRLNVDVRNITNLLSRYVTPGSRFLEVGFAPGKMLSWVASRLKAQVTGVDYSPTGVERGKELFTALGIAADLRCEDILKSSLPTSSFDVVYSGGLIEHFEDPLPMVRRHIEFVKPGGRAVILVPDYGGLYGRFQARFDPQNLDLHNTSIMSVQSLMALAPDDLAASKQAFRSGKFSPWLLSLHKVAPGPIARVAAYGLNALGLLQPWTIERLSPLLALIVVRR